MPSDAPDAADLGTRVERQRRTIRRLLDIDASRQVEEVERLTWWKERAESAEAEVATLRATLQRIETAVADIARRMQLDADDPASGMSAKERLLTATTAAALLRTLRTER